MSAKKGNYCGAFAPFGLMKDPKNTSKLIIDYGASDIVVRIFKLRCDGLSYRKIASFK